MAKRCSQSIGRIRLGNCLQAKQQSDHMLYLALIGATTTNHSFLDVPSSIFKDRKIRFERST
jgi:hypothetical protein